MYCVKHVHVCKLPQYGQGQAPGRQRVPVHEVKSSVSMGVLQQCDTNHMDHGRAVVQLALTVVDHLPLQTRCGGRDHAQMRTEKACLYPEESCVIEGQERSACAGT